MHHLRYRGRQLPPKHFGGVRGEHARHVEVGEISVAQHADETTVGNHGDVPNFQLAHEIPGLGDARLRRYGHGIWGHEITRSHHSSPVRLNFPREQPRCQAERQYETGTLKVGEKTGMRHGCGVWGTASPVLRYAGLRPAVGPSLGIRWRASLERYRSPPGTGPWRFSRGRGHPRQRNAEPIVTRVWPRDPAVPRAGRL